ncbi:MAG: hypothetical protein ACK5HP_04125 [Bacilli bacterium]
MLAEFSYKFRHDIFTSHLSTEEQQIILSDYSYERTELLNYYKVSINDFKGVRINIDDTLQTMLISQIEIDNMLITI